MLFNKRDDDNFMIIISNGMNNDRRKNKLGSYFYLFFKIIKLVAIFLIILFLIHRLPIWVSNILAGIRSLF